MTWYNTSQCSRYSDSLRAGRAGDRIPVEARFSAHVQGGPGPHTAFCTIGTISRGMTMNTYPYLGPRLGSSRALPLLPLCAFPACSKVTCTSIFFIRITWKAEGLSASNAHSNYVVMINNSIVPLSNLSSSQVILRTFIQACCHSPSFWTVIQSIGHFVIQPVSLANVQSLRHGAIQPASLAVIQSSRRCCHSASFSCRRSVTQTCHSGSFWTVIQSCKHAVIQPVSLSVFQSLRHADIQPISLSVLQSSKHAVIQPVSLAVVQSLRHADIQPVSGQSFSKAGMQSFSQFPWRSCHHSNKLSFSQFLDCHLIKQACSHSASFPGSHSIRHLLCYFAVI